ncbi:MAG TPA: hypothetical protein VEA80_14520 [Vitreimonas sp.]|uniref:hypothetical protein n=1 Tax=Vitreimonas sp. TaxID=3069702 RepID=UPI002D2B6B24|nr:hypothetical protein [Vitreimonas sp.]HYD88685.1 hypothetical protein [Vitreimonas sp.]
MTKLTTAQAERRMEELLNRVQRGEEFLINEGEACVKLAPLTKEERERLRDEPPPRDEI